MTISYSHLPAFIQTLQDASRDEKLWLGFDSRIQMASVNDLHLFDTPARADDFVHFNKGEERDITLLPVEATRYFLHESARSRLQEGIPSPHIEMDVPAIHAIYEEMRFDHSMTALEELMDSFDWSKTFYDPLEANTEAESVEDKIAFNRLEFLVEQLSSFAQTGERASAAVADLMQRHWAGQAMETQTEDVLIGTYRLKNEAMYMNYGINPDENPLYNRDGNAFTDTLIDHWDQQQLLNNKTNVMNDNNFAYLKDNIKYTGFGEALYTELEKNIKEQKPEFQLHFTTQLNNKPFNATLNFRKSDNSDMYFFNSYKASFERSNGEKMEQSFQIKKGKGVTAKEAYNLLQGRAVYKDMVNKENQPYKAWLHLDFDKKDKYGNYEVLQKHDNYGYDLKEAIGKFPVLELDGGEKEKDLLRSLEKGNAQSVTIEVNGKPEKFFLEANPEYKSVNVYDSGFTLQKHDELLSKIGQQVPKASVGQENKQDTAQGQKQAEKKTNTQKNGKGLINKKRTRNQKGVKIS